MMRTRDSSTWAVELVEANILDATFEFEATPTYFLYEPQLPYLYLPEHDFLTYMGYATK
jgi:hypothetical protein